MDADRRAGEPLRIIVADDDEDSRRLVARMFGQLDGFDVIGTAHDLETTRELAGERHPDVVLLDRVMPGFDGPEALDGLRAASPGAAIVVLSGYGRDDPEAAAVGAVVDGYVEKGAPKRVVVRAVVDAANGTAERITLDGPRVVSGGAASLGQIADALHDGPIQSLSGALWMLESLESEEGDRRTELLADLRTALESSLASTRRVMRWAREHEDDAHSAG